MVPPVERVARAIPAHSTIAEGVAEDDLEAFMVLGFGVPLNPKP